MTAYSNAFEVAANLTARGARAAAASVRITRQYGMLLETRIKANASGRPGPNAPTGDYRRSWNTVVSSGGGLVRATVGTNKPQARRLEYGFYGVDALGRSYNQPPYAHVGPAADAVLPAYSAAMADILTEGP